MSYAQRSVLRSSLAMAVASAPGLLSAAPAQRAVPSHETHLALHLRGGAVSYEERVSILPVDSEWDARFVEVGGALRLQPARGASLRFRGALWRSGSDTETWAEDNEPVQRNDLEVTGWDLGVDVGARLKPADGTEIAPWIGLGVRGQRFEREAFAFLDEEGAGDPGLVTEDVRVPYAALSVDASQRLSRKVSLVVEALAGFVFNNQADNSLFGSIDGGGGTLVEAGAYLKWRISDTGEMLAGARYARQDLDGGTEARMFQAPDGSIVTGVVEWPDNTLEQKSLEVRWQNRF